MRQRALPFVFASIVVIAGCDKYNKARDLAGKPPLQVDVPLGDPTGGSGGATATLTAMSRSAP